MTYSIFDIANWFLHKVTCDQKKLQKLCYYAQAWHLAMYGSELCTASFEAWVHGPVNRMLWDYTKKYGFEDIPADYFQKSAKEIDDGTDQFLNRVLVTYGGFSGFDLECLSHTEDPWINARTGCSEMERCTRDITNKDMMNYYRSLISGDGIGEG